MRVKFVKFVACAQSDAHYASTETVQCKVYKMQFRQKRCPLKRGEQAG